MKAFCYALIGFLMLSLPACAGEKTKEFKLTTGEAYALADVFRSKLTSYEKVVTEGGRDRAVPAFYQFEVATRMAFARNLQALEYVTKAADKARQELVIEQSNGRGTFDEKIPEQAAALARVNVAWAEALNRVTAFNLIMFTEAELKLKDNVLPVPVMTALLPLID